MSEGKRLRWSTSLALLTISLLGLVPMSESAQNILIVHYHRYEEDYEGWTLWTWDDKTDGGSIEIDPAGRDDYGLLFTVSTADYGDGTRIGLLPKFGNWMDKDPPDRIWSTALGDKVWILSGDERLYTEQPRPGIRAGHIDDVREVVLVLPKKMSPEEIVPSRFHIEDEDGRRVKIAEAEGIPPATTKTQLIRLITDQDLDVKGRYNVSAAGREPCPLLPRRILDQFVSDQELGAIYRPDRTIFRCFAPSASSVRVVIYDEAEAGSGREFSLKVMDGGIWEGEVDGDLRGMYYTLKATGGDVRFDPERELIDPYSRCNTAHDGRGLILHDKTPVADRPAFDISQSVIYELHIRDFTIDEESGIEQRGKYLGLAEEETIMPGQPTIKTGLDHLKELGVNVVQIMPIQDFENDEASTTYNWGYMPVHFNSPDGWYATERHSPARVQEFKRLVDAFHRNGIKVVMDVVYNHTAETEPFKIFSFNGLVPGYYYRLDDVGNYWNGSGTGNEVRSEAPMVRKFILDSVEYWVREYTIDGFRFDLMGLIDLETMEEIVQKLIAIYPDILIYGEPWTGGSTPIVPTLKGSQRGGGFAVFNDHFRDAIKGGVFDISPGYVQAGVNIEKIKRGIEGSINDFADGPLETVNYVACHDNRTFWDRLAVTTERMPGIADEDRRRMDKLGAVLLLTSQGIPFIHSGQEMLRTKGGDHNSFNRPDAVNKIRWCWKANNIDVFEYYRGLIGLRKRHPLFRMKTKEVIQKNLKFLDDNLGMEVPPKCVAYSLSRGELDDPWQEVVLLFNPNGEMARFTLPPGRWRVVVDDAGVRDESKRSELKSVSRRVEVPKRSAMVLFR